MATLDTRDVPPVPNSVVDFDERSGKKIFLFGYLLHLSLAYKQIIVFCPHIAWRRLLCYHTYMFTSLHQAVLARLTRQLKLQSTVHRRGFVRVQPSSWVPFAPTKAAAACAASSSLPLKPVGARRGVADTNFPYSHQYYRTFTLAPYPQRTSVVFCSLVLLLVHLWVAERIFGTASSWLESATAGTVDTRPFTSAMGTGVDFWKCRLN